MRVPALSLRNVAKSFGGLRVLEDITLVAGPGERRAVIGPNGAGKTTLFHILSGVLQPDAGSIELYGRDITGYPIHRRVGLGMARTFQITNLFPNLTVEQNLFLALQALKPTRYAMLRAIDHDRDLIDRAGALLERWQLSERRRARINELSYGEQRSLEILLAVSQQPKVLLLDEPTAGLSPGETSIAIAIIEALPRELTMILIEHDMDVAFRVCDTVTVLHAGNVLADGTVSEVRSNVAVQSIYLGAATEVKRRDTGS